MDYQDSAALEEECEEGRRFGFAGKQAIHPDQIDIIQRKFLPNDSGKLDSFYCSAFIHLCLFFLKKRT